MPEAAFEPDWFSKPGDTISALIAHRRLSHIEVASSLGVTNDFLRALLIGLTPLSGDLPDRVSAVVGGTAAFWRRRQDAYDKSLNNIANLLPAQERKVWLRQLPTGDIARFLNVGAPSKQIEKLKLCLSYFAVSSPSEWKQKYTDFLSTVEFRTSPSFSSKVGALSAWVRKAELEASLIETRRYERKVLSNRINELRGLTRLKSPRDFFPQARKICASAGVALVVVKSPKGCRASGAARFISKDKAYICLSCRHLTDDQFWFTLFHEIGHLILHQDSRAYVDAEGLENSTKEGEADVFSQSVLIPSRFQDEMMAISPRANDIIRFAVKTRIAPGLVVGRMQHASLIGYDQFNFLKRRYTWEEIEEATR